MPTAVGRASWRPARNTLVRTSSFDQHPPARLWSPPARALRTPVDRLSPTPVARTRASGPVRVTHRRTRGRCRPAGAPRGPGLRGAPPRSRCPLARPCRRRASRTTAVRSSQMLLRSSTGCSAGAGSVGGRQAERASARKRRPPVHRSTVGGKVRLSAAPEVDRALGQGRQQVVEACRVHEAAHRPRNVRHRRRPREVVVGPQVAYLLGQLERGSERKALQ